MNSDEGPARNPRAQATQAARRAGDNPVLEAGARLGYLVNGLLHLLIGWLALQLGFGRSAGSADQSGAFSTLGSSGIGQALLWVALVGFALLAIWQVVEAVGGNRTSARVKSGAKAVLYGVLAVAILQFLLGVARSSSGQSVDATARVMSAPMGRALVAAFGVGVLAVAAYHVYKGVTKKFLEDLDDHPGRPAEVAGQVGYIAKGVALALVGGLFVLAGLQNQPGEATGLDGGMRQLLELPFGQAILVLVAVGFVLFALYCVARARHAKV